LIITLPPAAAAAAAVVVVAAVVVAGVVVGVVVGVGVVWMRSSCSISAGISEHRVTTLFMFS